MNRDLGKSKPRMMDRLKQEIQARQLTVDGQAHRLEQLNEWLERVQRAGGANQRYLT